MFNTFNLEQFIWIANQQIVDFSGEALDEYRFLCGKKVMRKDLDYTGFCILPFELNGVALYALTCVFFNSDGDNLSQFPWWFEDGFCSKRNDFLSCLSVAELGFLADFVEKDNLKKASHPEAFENLNKLLEQAKLREKLLEFANKTI